MKFLPLFIFCLAALSAEPTCKKCEVIREYNKEHPGDFEFYEDYLKSQDCAKQAPTEKPATK